MNIDQFEARVNIFINNIKYINEEAAEFILKNKLKFFANNENNFKNMFKKGGDVSVLFSLFYFGDSPQGVEFWQNIVAKLEEMHKGKI